MSWAASWLKYMVRLRLAPYVPAPPTVGAAMLDLARLKPGEAVIDLGCGDGRLLRQAVSDYGASRAIGYELDADLVATARAAAGHDARIEVRHEDALGAGAEVARADVVALYLTEHGNSQVLPLLRTHLRPTARVVSYCWGLGGLPPTRTAQAAGQGVVISVGKPNLLLWERGDLFDGPKEESR